MALPDPIPTITIDSVAYDLARIGMMDSKSIYQTANGLDRLTIEHQVTKNRNRQNLRFDRRKIAADPFDADLNQEYSFSTYVVTDSPKWGVTSAELDVHFQLLAGLWSAGTPDYGLRILQGEI